MSRFDNKKPSKFLVSLVTIILLILVVLLGWLLWPSQSSQVDASPSPTLSVVVPTESPEAPKVTKPAKEPEAVVEHAPAEEEPVVVEPAIEAPAPVDSSDVYVTAEEVVPIVEEPAPVVEVVEPTPVVEPAPVVEVPVAEVPASGAYSSPNYAMWESIAQCESGGNWGIQTGNGYYGGLQFLPSSWAAAGGVGNPADASKEEQMRVADNLLAMQGPGAWGCYGR